jgi:hypothetical protein
MSSPLVTFEEARLNHLRNGMVTSFAEKMQWLEEACSFAEQMRKNRFARGEPVIDQVGRVSWSEEEYWDYPTER